MYLADQEKKHDRQIAYWLLSCAMVIFGMVILGGVTRLTHSGLSMVEWKPLLGIIPPLGEQAWLEVFGKYKQFPEYQKINLGMTLEEFKSIFLFEYWHRVLGRLIGIIFLLPFLVFKFSGKVRPSLTPKLIVLFVLGALQGLLGWYMVKSGLVDNPHVSQYRLTAHLGLALIIYSYMLWVAFGLLAPDVERRLAAGLGSYARVLVGLVFLMILTGGLVAGTRAGFAYNTWPLMGDSFIPDNIYAFTPSWLAAFEDITTIQFNHRMFAYLLFFLISGFSIVALRAQCDNRLRSAIVLLLAVLVAQLSLGIATLLFHVPVSLGAAHQAGAVCLLTVILFVAHRFTAQELRS